MPSCMFMDLFMRNDVCFMAGPIFFKLLFVLSLTYFCRDGLHLFLYFLLFL